MDIYRDAKRRGIYPWLLSDPKGKVRETTRHFSFHSQNSEYPRIFQVTGTNQNARKLLSTDLVDTKN